MIKQISKELLMEARFLAKNVIIETNIGGITERFAGQISKQRFVGTAEEVTLSTQSGFFTIGVASVEKVSINVDTSLRCPKCKKIELFGVWVVIDLPMKFPDYLFEDKLCPECAKEE